MESKRGLPVKMCDLPAEILVHICSSLDARSLCRFGQTCKKLRSISRDDTVWKQLCKREFLLNDCSEGDTWYKVFRLYHSRFGRLHNPSVYRAVRHLWDRLEKYLQENDPQMFDSLREPCSMSEISIAEQKMKCRFPPDLRCSLQIHNGQQMRMQTGILGSMTISSYFRSEGLLDAASMARLYADDDELPGCVPLTYCYVSRKSQYMAVDDVGGFTIGEVFYPSLDQQSSEVDIFITGKSYLAWFTELVETLEMDRFPRIDNTIYRFYQDPSCMARTNDCFTVRASTCFMPDLSTVNPTRFFYTYRITMSMDKDADPKHSCQLETRHWIIADMDNLCVEEVNGSGVVGQYPVMTPGAEFSWISCNTFAQTYGSTSGFFTMKNLEAGEPIHIQCPTFYMKCLPYKTASERREILLQRKKNL